MARPSANSLLNSLKGKIWLATSALAFFICAFGLVAYLLASLLVGNTLFAVFAPFLFLALTVMIFGWWLSNEVVSPIEKVTLLAKTLERGTSVALPKTSGSTETDELLATLHRNNQQLQNIVGLMDKVANGDLDVAFTPLQSGDRLSNSFQKLLAKVADSLDAKKNLAELESAVKQISAEIADVGKGNLNADLKTDLPATREITAALKYLLGCLNEFVAEARNETNAAKNSTGDALKILQSAIQTDESNVQEINEAMLTLQKIPQTAQQISEEITASAASVNHLIEKAKSGERSAQENLAAVANLRKQIQAAVKRVSRTGEHSLELGKIGKSVADLANRSKLIALNAAVQNEASSDGGFLVFAEEVKRLAERADALNKEIASLNQSMTAEIDETEVSLHLVIQDAANLSRHAIETGNSLSDLEKTVGRFLLFQHKLTAHSDTQAVEIENAFQIFAAAVSATENALTDLKTSETHLHSTVAALGNLTTATAEFKVAEKPAPINLPTKIEDSIGLFELS